MCKSTLRYVADDHTLAKHEETLRIAALSAAQVKSFRLCWFATRTR